MGKKITGTRLSPNTRYLVYQPRLTDAIIVILELLSYEHPCNGREPFSFYRQLDYYMTGTLVCQEQSDDGK